MSGAISHLYQPTNGIRLHVAAAGPADGPLIILLHGFPDFWYGWRRQIPALAQAGFRVWAPDQRGYNLSDKPRSAAAYRLDEVAGDVAGLVDASGRDRAVVVGHDWGGLAAWRLAVTQPERVERLIILNAPHPLAFRRHLLRSPAQMARSTYAFFFQLPALPEWLARRRNWAPAERALRVGARPGTFTDADLERYRQAWSRPGAFTAMLNWYRATLRHPPHLSGEQRVTVPALIIWGGRDVALSSALAEQSLAFCDDGRLVFMPEATHWVQHDEPARVNALIAAFASGAPLPAA
jgi:pimeloyl-ACP methyl ester carboxylesterase